MFYIYHYLHEQLDKKLLSTVQLMYKNLHDENILLLLLLAGNEVIENKYFAYHPS